MILDVGLFRRTLFEEAVQLEEWSTVEYVRLPYIFSAFDFSHGVNSLKERTLEVIQTAHVGLKRWRLDRLLRRIPDLNHAFLGSISTSYDLHMRHIAKHLKYDSLVVLDNGIDTIRCAEERKREILDRLRTTASVFGKMSARAKFRQRYFTWDRYSPDAVTFFSAYDIDVASPDRLERNEYMRCRSMAQDRYSDDLVWVLGEALVDDEILTERSYLRVMDDIFSSHSDGELVYIAHPRESEEMLDKIRARYSIEVVRFVRPVEIEIVQASVQPRTVVSFCSSALENLATIYGGSLRVLAYRPNAEDFLRQRDKIQTAYDHLKARCPGVSVIEP